MRTIVVTLILTVLLAACGRSTPPPQTASEPPPDQTPHQAPDSQPDPPPTTDAPPADAAPADNPFAPANPESHRGTPPGIQPGMQPGGNPDTPPAATGSLAGTYLGTLDNKPIGLTITLAGTAVAGQAVSDGWLFPLEGTLADGKATGRVRTPLGIARFTLERTNAGVRLTLTADQPQAGAQAQTIDLAPAPPTRLPQETITRDERITGHWRYTFSQSSEGMSIVWDDWLRLMPDGSYKYGERNKPEGWDYSNVQTGQWRTWNSVIFTRGEGQPDWTPAARYQVSGNDMIVYWPNGNKQYFERIR